MRGGQVAGVIMHTDRGSEYTAGLVRQACYRLSIFQSMGRPGPRLIYASSMLLDSARRKVSVPAPARWLLGLGIGATPAANAAHGLGHGPVGAAILGL